MFWKKLFCKQKPESKDLTIFELRAELSFCTIAQVSYIAEDGLVKIARFFSDSWTKEVLSISGEVAELQFKAFVNPFNLTKNETLKLSVSVKGEVLLEKIFSIEKDSENSTWLELH
jgi:hypothetical protein